MLVGGGSGILSDSRKLETASHFGGVVPPSASMHELLAKHGVDEVDFLKVDIEGSEIDLFRSGPQWIGKTTRIAMEVHPGHGDIAELVGLIASHGFHVELRNNDLERVEAIPAAGGYVFATRTADG